MVSVVPDSINFSEAEEEVYALWQRIDAFRSSLAQSAAANRPHYIFYDGPPFATGLPHYGHILAGTIKDIVPRWAHMSGYHTERRFGWDTHGLPVEYEVDKTLGIKGPEDVAKMGIAVYNNHCRKIVMRYSEEWETIISRLGRWVDFKNDYKTFYPSYMESVWWVFKQLYDKGLVYNGVKVMPYSSACSTPLSNFEAGQNYKDVVDPSVVVSFPLVDQPDVWLLAWTTTPWTLPSNLLLCVNPTLEYVKVRDKKTDQQFVLLESRLEVLYKKPIDECEILDRFAGSKLEGLHYQPIFDYFTDYAAGNNAFVVTTDNYVTSESGTGIVHCAPYFGEDDHRVALKVGVIRKDSRVICPLDLSCRFVEPVTDFLGLHVKDADKEIIKKLKAKGRLIRENTVKHSYPFCWRSDTPLIYRAIPSWFVRVEEHVTRLLENNKETYWVPDFVKEKRFGNWLRDARDWAISRNRYWGTPIPLWISEDGEEIVCIGSIAELEQLTNTKVTDLHRESVDNLTIPSSRPGKPPLRRVPEVFDCWFESGSMPYAQVHYPFENKQLFEANFPAHFIAEGVDQTRGWFYTLLVISTLLFDKPPFRNLICNGLILAADGQKMSKRKKNYPDPMEVVKKYGADALRLYLINSPVVRAENLRFREEGVRELLKDVFLPWFNAYRFFVQNLLIYEDENPGEKFYFDKRQQLKPTNIMDRWILSFTQSLFKFVKTEMKAYRFYTVVPRLIKFVDNLTNWYVRMNRKRLKGENGAVDTRQALDTLFAVLLSMIEMMAPFTPFITEHMYQNLRKVLIDGVELPNGVDAQKTTDATTENGQPETTKLESVHYILHSEVCEELIDENVERQVSYMQAVIELGRLLRDRRNMPLKYPLPEVVVITNCERTIQDIALLKEFILDELNVRDLTLSREKEKYGVKLKAEADIKALGLRLRADSKKVIQAIRNLTDEQLMAYQSNPEDFTVEGVRLEPGDMRVKYTLAEDGLQQKGFSDKYEADSADGVLVLLDVVPDSAMKDEGIAREIINRVQKLRKEVKLVPSDPICVYFKVESNGKADLERICSEFGEYIENSLKTNFINMSIKAPPSNVLIRTTNEIKGENIELAIERLDDVNETGGDSNMNGTATSTTTGPFVRYTNYQLKTGTRTVLKTFLHENPLGCSLTPVGIDKWSLCDDQSEPNNKYVNVQTVGIGGTGGGNHNNNSTVKATVLLDTATGSSPFMSSQLNSWNELRLNVAVALNYHLDDVCTLYSDVNLQNALRPEELDSSEKIVTALDRKTIYVKQISHL